MGETSFGTVDYAVFFLMLLISSSIGLYVRFTGGRQKTASVSEQKISNSSFSFFQKLLEMMLTNGFFVHFRSFCLLTDK